MKKNTPKDLKKYEKLYSEESLMTKISRHNVLCVIVIPNADFWQNSSQR